MQIQELFEFNRSVNFAACIFLLSSDALDSRLISLDAPDPFECKGRGKLATLGNVEWSNGCWYLNREGREDRLREQWSKDKTCKPTAGHATTRELPISAPGLGSRHNSLRDELPSHRHLGLGFRDRSRMSHLFFKFSRMSVHMFTPHGLWYLCPLASGPQAPTEAERGGGVDLPFIVSGTQHIRGSDTAQFRSIRHGL
jgi:hypothetical protein